MPAIAKAPVIDAFPNLLHRVSIPHFLQGLVPEITHRGLEPGGTTGKSRPIRFQVDLSKWVTAKSPRQRFLRDIQSPVMACARSSSKPRGKAVPQSLSQCS